MRRVLFALLTLCGLLWSESAQAQKAVTVWKDGQPTVIVEADSVFFWKVPAEAVDLGLPSGTKWASCNVGATRPEEYGGYYAWGETEEKDWYDWGSYLHCDGTESTCHNLGSSISGTQYDVAYVKWLGKWRMPTKDEIKELIDNCTSEWTRVVGVTGRLFTGPNGNSIFLPAAGDRWEDYLDNDRRYGHYWSGTLESGFNAYALGFRSGSSVSQSPDYRSNGFSIRPVLLEYALLALSTDAVSLEVGGSETVEITAGNGEYSCTSEDPSVVSASLEGTTLTLTALKAGETQVVVTDLKTQQTVAIAVIVNYPDLALSTDAVSLVVGGSETVEITAGSGEYSCTSEDPSVVSGSLQGTTLTLTALKAGETQVVVTDLKTQQTAAIAITVSAPQGYTVTVNGVSFTMIKVEAGTFQMGSTSGDYSEKPVHQVTLTNDYYIGETEVTQELWQAVMGSNPSEYKDSKLPVEQVSWNDCQTFIAKLNELTGKNFRLPTEAEWEFAARGGNASRGYTYSGSNTVGDVAWYSSIISSKVATKAPNELGIYDMSGNVSEWCQDWYGSYSSNAQTNPAGPASGSFRVNRGGAWGSYDFYCRVASRGRTTPSDWYDSLGLRLVF